MKETSKGTVPSTLPVETALPLYIPALLRPIEAPADTSPPKKERGSGSPGDETHRNITSHNAFDMP
jgi:hypothetical protein